MAYIFWGIGLIWRFGVHQSMNGVTDTYAIVYIVRLANALFTLVDGAVLYALIRGRGLSLRASRIVVVAFLFNPAIWFANEVWATTQTISVLFLLLSLLAVEKRAFAWAWLAIFASILTRPQNIFPGIVLGAILLGYVGWRKGLRDLSWGVLGTFLLLAPLSLLVSPTLSGDILANAFFLHVGSGNDAWTTPVSWGGMSVWPLLSILVHGAHGTGAILFPASGPFLGGISAYRLGTALSTLAVALMALLGATRSRRLIDDGRYLLFLPVTSLLMFYLNSGTPTYHFVLALVLLYAAIPVLNVAARIATIATLTSTTFLSMYAMGAYWLSGHPVWGFGVYNPQFLVTRTMTALSGSDVFVVVCCIANGAVIVYLAALCVSTGALTSSMRRSPDVLDIAPRTNEAEDSSPIIRLTDVEPIAGEHRYEAAQVAE